MLSGHRFHSRFNSLLVREKNCFFQFLVSKHTICLFFFLFGSQKERTKRIGLIFFSDLVTYFPITHLFLLAASRIWSPKLRLRRLGLAFETVDVVFLSPFALSLDASSVREVPLGRNSGQPSFFQLLHNSSLCNQLKEASSILS